MPWVIAKCNSTEGGEGCILPSFSLRILNNLNPRRFFGLIDNRSQIPNQIPTNTLILHLNPWMSIQGPAEVIDLCEWKKWVLWLGTVGWWWWWWRWWWWWWWWCFGWEEWLGFALRKMSHFDSSFLSKVSNGCRNHLVTWILVFGCSAFGVVASYLPKWWRSMSSFAVELLPKWDKHRRFLYFDTSTHWRPAKKDGVHMFERRVDM